MRNKKIALIGLGHEGLPHALEFGKKRYVIGFDIDQYRFNDLRCIFLPRYSDFLL